MIQLLFQKLYKHIKAQQITHADNDITHLLMDTRYPNKDYLQLMILKCSMKKLLDNHYKLTSDGQRKLLKQVQEIKDLHQKVLQQQSASKSK